MKGHIAEEQLALYAAGDLAGDEQHKVAAHLGTCGECRNTAAEFRETRTFLAESLSDPEAADLLLIRESVLRRLAHQQGGGRRWAWVVVGAAAMLALAVVPLRFEHRQPIASKPAPVIARIVPSKQTPPPAVETAGLHRRHPHHQDAGIRSVALITRQNQPPLIKIATADPNVVILWQSNQTEDE